MSVSLEHGRRIAGASIIVLVLGVGALSLGVGSCQNLPPIKASVCLSCHDGRSAPNQLGFLVSAHRSIECEVCHGSGYLHVRNGGRGGLFITNPAKLSFPETYATCNTCHADTVVGFLASHHAVEQVVTCADCHDVHQPGGMQANPTDNTLCLQCHAELGFDSDAAISTHTFHPVDPAGTGASRCTACHLPPLQREDQADGPHDHTLLTIPPIRSNEAAAAGVTPIPPNSCSGITGCHDGTVPEAPVFDVDNLALNEILQSIYDARYGD
ncbi:MAG: hypothetical protein HY706_18105 [Candidatus Hydrogenedentes bacterium]|nr:hypothetical protein [Candidatus Hydrogenedentota bacterium]